MDDHTAVVSIRTAASNLPLWRRWLIERRCRRVFGEWTRLAIEFPTKPSGDETVAAWLSPAIEHSDDGVEWGLRQRAYSELPGHPAQHKLSVELRRLAGAR
jgi:hypothetical protein